MINNKKRFLGLMLVVFALFISLSAVSAGSDDLNNNAADVLAFSDADDSIDLEDCKSFELDNENAGLSANNDDMINANNSSSVYKITEGTYSNYFDSKGYLNNSSVSIGDTIDLSGNFTNKSFIFKIPLTVTSLNNDSYLYNCHVAFINTTNESFTPVVSNLNMEMHVDVRLMIVVNNSCGVKVINNVLYSSGANSYPISLVDFTNGSLVANNTIKTVVSNRFAQNVEKENGDNSSWQHSGITLLDSFHNDIRDNNIVVEDSYGIYLCYGQTTSDYNNIVNNTIRSSIKNPSFWTYGIYLMGRYNYIANNTLVGVYRGISATSPYNVIVSNKIYNITGIDVDTQEKTGGDYVIYGSSNAVIANNSIYGADVFKAGIIVGSNSKAYGNYIEIVSNANGILIGGVEGGSNGDSNYNVSNNTIMFLGGIGILVEGYPNNVSIEENIIDSLSEVGGSRASGNGVGIDVIYQSRDKRTTNISIIDNKIYTSNDVAINLNQSSLEYFINNERWVFGKAIIYPNIRNVTKKIGNGIIYNISESNFNDFFNSNGTLKSFINDSDTLILKGEFSPKGNIILDKSVFLIGDEAILKNTTIRVYAPDCTIENITIINNGTDECNLWGIYVFETDGASIIGNNITVWDRNTSYGIYLCDSKNNTVANNNIKTQGDELVFSLLNYEVYNTLFENNTIKTIGTGKLYPYIETLSIDGVHSISELSKTYGAIFDFSSDNTFIHNDMNVTSTVKGYQIPYQPSVNILIGLYIYYDSNRNNISENNLWVEGRDPFLYGMGCSGDDTSKSSTTADNNVFSRNNITLRGDYFVMGIILRHNSMFTSLDSNNMDLKAINYSYGVTLEIAGFTNVSKNTINSTANGSYMIELYSSYYNVVEYNTIYGNGSYMAGPSLYESDNNIIKANTMVAISYTDIDPVMAQEHPDSVSLEAVGILIEKHSDNNIVVDNDISTNQEVVVHIDESSNGNYVGNNRLNGNTTSGDGAVKDDSGKNTVSGNTGTATHWSNKRDSNHQDSNANSTVKSSVKGGSAISGTSSSSGASGLGAVDSGLTANAKSASGEGSGDAGTSGESADVGGVTATEVHAVGAKSASPYAVPIIILLILALFFYSFLADKNDDEDDYI